MTRAGYGTVARIRGLLDSSFPPLSLPIPVSTSLVFVHILNGFDSKQLAGLRLVAPDVRVVLLELLHICIKTSSARVQLRILHVVYFNESCLPGWFSKGGGRRCICMCLYVCMYVCMYVCVCTCAALGMAVYFALYLLKRLLTVCTTKKEFEQIRFLFLVIWPANPSIRNCSLSRLLEL